MLCGLCCCCWKSKDCIYGSGELDIETMQTSCLRYFQTQVFFSYESGGPKEVKNGEKETNGDEAVGAVEVEFRLQSEDGLIR